MTTTVAFVASKGREATPRLRHTVGHATGLAEKQDQKNQYMLRVGHAVDTLRTDVPSLLTSSGGLHGHLPDFSIYSQEITFSDARAPSLELRGLQTYRRLLSAMQWSVSAMCEESHLDVTSLQTPVNNELYMRWRLHLWPKNMLTHAKDLLGPALGRQQEQHFGSMQGEPFIVEGYSRYEFDPWSAEIIKHSIDITNPPLYISDLLRRYVAPVQGVTSVTPNLGLGFHVVPQVSQKTSFEWTLPQSCSDDFECNGGRANFPLRCCELPIIGSFCCEPDNEPSSREPAYVPLPVPAREPWHP